MPYDDPDPTDPMTLQGIAIETDDPNVQREMAECYIEEYLRMGYDRDRVLAMFRMPQYVGPVMAYEALGGQVIERMIDDLVAVWGGRRDPGTMRRDGQGDVISGNEDRIKNETRVRPMSSTQCGHHEAATTPTQVLKEEHRVIERVLDAMDRMASAEQFDEEFVNKALDFVRNFSDGCHHAKEEDLFFPALEAAGIPRENGPIGVMLMEHDQGRRLIGLIAENVRPASQGEAKATTTLRLALSEFVTLLRGHIDKEDNILFAMGDQVLNSEQQQKLLQEFAHAESCTGDPGKHERYLALADELSQWSFVRSELNPNDKRRSDS